MADPNAPFAQGIIAGMLRLGKIKPEQLVTPGMYDPALDWQGQNQALGQTFVRGDYDMGNARRNEGLYGGDFTYQGQQFHLPGSLADIDRMAGESITDLDTRQARGDEDYHTAIDNLQRQYTRLGSQQATGIRRSGLGQGALAQAMGKRTANQAIDRQPIEQSWRRLTEDVTRDKDRVHTGQTNARGSALYGAMTGQQDADTGMDRANSADTLFQNQLGSAKVQSAQQLGALPVLPTPTFGDAPKPVTTAGQVGGFKRMGIPGATPVHQTPTGPYFTQPAVGGGVWHIYPDGRKVKVPA